MMPKFRLAIATLATLVGMSTPSFAQSQASTPAQGQAPVTNNAPNLDPNEKVCQTQEVTGSRLGHKRVCKTRAEWADFQLQERQQVEKVQVQRHMPGN